MDPTRKLPLRITAGIGADQYRFDYRGLVSDTEFVQIDHIK
jgi:hypothetical protein